MSSVPHPRTSICPSIAVEGAVSLRAAVRLLVRGQVQGVGFRPFIYRLAQQCQLGGSVANGPAGVVIEIEGAPEALTRFRQRLLQEAPSAAKIDGLLGEVLPPAGRSRFTIQASESSRPPGVRLARDLAMCPDCQREIGDPANRRWHYPFATCTACGPRYSLIEAMPYDRAATAMRRFAACAECSMEYRSPGDRRLHAQTNACAVCGPQIALWDREGRVIAGPDTALGAAAALVRQGQIVALKGLGGFQLLVRADQTEPVLRLRQRKNRPRKPLAIMVPSLDVAEQLAVLDPAERQLLKSSQNPIVLASARPGATEAAIAPRVHTIGLFLPTTPLHQLLLAELEMPVVATSGNRSEGPIVTDEGEAVRCLAGLADAFLVHDRPVVRRLDDSVVRLIAGRPVTLRLARGYAPLPLPTLEGTGCPPVLATGGHQKAALALWSGIQAVLAQHLGDLDGPDTRSVFDLTTHDLSALYQFEPGAIACDLHPDYFTSQWALARHKPVFPVQHHHAHAVACMVEHELLDREVLAFTWDGTGYGPDGTIWGGECLRVRREGFARVASLLPFPLPGGAAAIRHPNRTAFGLLHGLFGEEAILRDDRWTRRLGLSPREGQVLAAMVRRGVHTPWTSSVGRLFDAVAALTLGVREVSYEGEAAVWLEAAADVQVTDAYELPLRAPEECRPRVGDNSCPRADWRPLLTALLADLIRDVEAGVIAARFHNALARWAAETADRLPLADIVLSGGCFQNRLLTERTLEELGKRKRQVFCASKVPPGDGGLAAGQLAVALARIERAGGGYVNP
jgi:hydrogenase maturation protein HypF